MTSNLIGRREELAIGGRFLDLLTGGPAALVVEGEAGIGKSSIIAAILDRATTRGARVLAARPAEPEASIAMSGLVALLTGIEDAFLARLPAPQRAAIDIALSRVDPGPSGIDRGALGVAMLTLISTLARERPLVIAIDDLQWLDPSTADALAFALRRLRNEPVGVLQAHRPEASAPLRPGAIFAAERITELRLGGLSLGGLRTLIADRLGVALDRSSLTKLEDLTGGSPFLALEIVGYLQRRGREIRVDELVPVPVDIQQLLDDRLAELPVGARDLLLVVAALGRPSVAQLSRVIPDVDLRAAVASAIDAGVIGLAEQRLTFEHPLFAAAVYGAAEPSRRRAIHLALATRLDDSDEAARHRALATDLPDEVVAEELEGAAGRAARRGAPALAADFLEHARRLTPAERVVDANRRTLALAQQLWAAGDIDRSRALAAEAEAAAAPGPERGGARLLLAAQALWLEGSRASIAWSERALDDASADPLLGARAHLRIAYAVEEHDVTEAARHLRDSIAILALQSGDDADDLMSSALLSQILLDLQAGLRADPDALARARALLPPPPDPVVPALAYDARAIARERDWLIRERLDDLVGARSGLMEVLAQDEARGFERSAVIGLADLAELETWLGDGASAAAHVDEASRLVERTGETGFAVAITRHAEAVVATNGGDLDAAKAAIEAGLAAARSAGHQGVLDRLMAVRGRVALAEGRPADAAAAFEAVARSLEASGARHPSVNRFAGDHAEALVLIGDTQAARAQVDRLEAAARRLGTPWLETIAARSRGTLAAADGHLEEALGAIDLARHAGERLSMPVELGRIDLLEGQVQRRMRQKRLAVSAFRRAIERFEGAGAAGWVERARRELGRVGLRPRAPDSLTPTEVEVARLAATGLTNRQVAETLFLSPKTIDSALGRVYRKLGIRSRAELGAAMSGANPAD